jgi:hypothetical protein
MGAMMSSLPPAVHPSLGIISVAFRDRAAEK